MSGRMHVFDYDVDGGLGPATVLHDSKPGILDGSALDADGTLWNARWGGECVLAIGKNGAVLARLEVEALNVTSVCFSGPDRTTKIITSAIWNVSDEQRAAYPQSGRVPAIEGNE